MFDRWNRLVELAKLMDKNEPDAKMETEIGFIIAENKNVNGEIFDDKKTES